MQLVLPGHQDKKATKALQAQPARLAQKERREIKAIEDRAARLDLTEERAPQVQLVHLVRPAPAARAAHLARQARAVMLAQLDPRDQPELHRQAV